MLMTISQQLSETLLRVGLAIIAFSLICVLRGPILSLARSLLKKLSIWRKIPLDITIHALFGLPVNILVLTLALHSAVEISTPRRGCRCCSTGSRARSS